MAELIHSVVCRSPAVVPYTLPSTPSTSLQLSVSSFATSRQWRPAPYVSSDLVKFPASVPRAHAQLQDVPSATPEEGIKWWERDLGTTLVDVHSTQELMDIIENAHGKLVVVEFFASWCGSCRALYPKLCKLAMENQDIVFVKVNFDENKAFCKSMNVKVLPYFHLYQGELKQIDSFSCSITKLQKLKDAIARFKVSDRLVDT